MLNERFIRAFVAVGSQVPPELVMPNSDGKPDAPGLYATVLLVTDVPEPSRINQAVYEHGDEGYYTAYEQYRRATYSVQFYRDGAVEAAQNLSFWVETDEGLLAAEGGLRDQADPPAWPHGQQIRVDMPLSYRRLDPLDKDTLEERTQIDFTALYSVVKHVFPSHLAPNSGHIILNRDGIEVLNKTLECVEVN